MRWCCPHCGVNLGIDDEKVGLSWSFSRCHQCGGFAMVRRSDTTPAPSERTKPIIRPAARRGTLAALEARTMVAGPTASAALGAIVSYAPAAPPPKHAMKRIPEAPAFLRQKTYVRQGSYYSGIAQAQAQAQATAEAVAAARPPVPVLEAETLTPPPPPTVLPDPLPEIPEPPLMKARVLPVAMGLASAIAVGSGIYLYIQGRALWAKARAQAAATRVERLSKAGLPAIPGGGTSAREPYMDQVHDQAMAPERAPANAPQVSPPIAPVPVRLMIRARANNVKLRSGPGPSFPIVAIADENTRYIVTDWANRWFKVLLRDPAHMPPAGDPPRTAWIPTESVQVIQNGTNPPPRT